MSVSWPCLPNWKAVPAHGLPPSVHNHLPWFLHPDSRIGWPRYKCLFKFHNKWLNKTPKNILYGMNDSCGVTSTWKEKVFNKTSLENIVTLYIQRFLVIPLWLCLLTDEIIIMMRGYSLRVLCSHRLSVECGCNAIKCDFVIRGVYHDVLLILSFV